MGVKLVVNDMSLSNAALAGKVKEALAQDAVVGNIPIDVEAEGTLVRLRRPDEMKRGQRNSRTASMTRS